jgi:hypothetical protein
VDAPVGFEQLGSRGFYRPSGEVSLEACVELMLAAIEFARYRGLRELVLNSTGFTGYEHPTVADRYEYGKRLATVAGDLRIAQVLRPDIIDPRRFGMLVATNRGADTNVFTNEADAVAWLDATDSNEQK